MKIFSEPMNASNSIAFAALQKYRDKKSYCLFVPYSKIKITNYIILVNIPAQQFNNERRCTFFTC